MITNPVYDYPFASAMRKSRNLLIALGVVMIVAGSAAIISPYFSTLGVTVCVGVMLIVAGIRIMIAGWTLVMVMVPVAVSRIFGGAFSTRHAD